MNTIQRLSVSCLLLAAASPNVSAIEFCVSTAAELESALMASELLPVPVDIRLQQGSYLMRDGSGPGPGFRRFLGNLTLSGGWNASCSSRSLDPMSTTINGQGDTSSGWQLLSNNSITLDTLHFLSTNELFISDDSQFECQAQGQQFTMRRLRIEGATNAPGSALWLDSSCHDMRVENSLITGGARKGIQIGCQSEARFQIVHTTVRDTALPSLQYGPESVDPCVADGFGLNQIINSVLQRVDLYGVSPLAINNIFDQLNSFDGAGLFPASGNNLIGNPQLDGNYRPIEPGSPAINAGTSAVPGGLPGTDIVGGARVVGSLPDRGAYESSVSNLFTLTVTSAADTGPGTLREIIAQANSSPGLNLIQFDIPGACPRIITLSSTLPSITDDVIINGFSQPNASSNTLDFGNNANLCIGLVGSQLQAVPFGLRVPPGSGATLKVRGLGFGGFDDGGGLLGEAAIYLQDGSGHEIQGNQFGGPFHSTSLATNTEAIRLFNNASSALVGGSSPANRNTISRSSLAGIQILGPDSNNHQIINNYIGTSPSGVSSESNNDGIRLIQTSGNTVLDNLISGNSRDAVTLRGEQATGNLIAGNRIGGRRSGVLLCGIMPLPPCPPLMTNRNGILIDDQASNNTIGAGGFSGAPNQIRFSTQQGIRILSGQRNRLLSNSLYDNGTDFTDYEIDLGASGLDPLDSDCGAAADARANRGQNRPVISAARLGDTAQSVAFEGNLSSCTNDGGFSSVYRLQFFVSDSCDSNGAGSGQTFLGDVNVILAGANQTDAAAAFDAELTHPWLELQGQFLTATATDLSGNTSEFSECVLIAADALFSDRFEP